MTRRTRSTLSVRLAPAATKSQPCITSWMPWSRERRAHLSTQVWSFLINASTCTSTVQENMQLDLSSTRSLMLTSSWSLQRSTWSTQTTKPCQRETKYLDTWLKQSNCLKTCWDNTQWSLKLRSFCPKQDGSRMTSRVLLNLFMNVCRTILTKLKHMF